MASASIYDNHQFIDHLYRCGQINKEIKPKIQSELLTKQPISREIERDLQKCAVHRVSSVNICLIKIKSVAPGSEEWEAYFNYIRWNQSAIGSELEFYLQQPCMEKHRGTITACQQLMDYVMDEFCKFTAADSSIINEFQHAFDIMSQSRRQQTDKVLLQAGKLFVNFVRLLSERYFYKETTVIKFVDIEMKAGVMIDKLSAGFPQQADAVKTVHENFVELRKMQDGYRAIQKDLLQKALQLAHARATESYLETAKRRMLDAISKVQRKLRDGLRTAIEVGEAFVHPIRHPRKIAENIYYALQHPLVTGEALIAWAKENPWKCAQIVVGGLCLGSVGFGGAALFIDYFFIDITSTVLTPLLVGAVGGGVTVPLSEAASRSRKLMEKAQNDEARLRSDYNSIERELNAQDEDIGLDDDWWTPLDEERKAAANCTDEQIDAMSAERLRQTESALIEYVPAIDEYLRHTHTDIVQRIQDMSTDQQEASVIQRASEILKRRIAATRDA